MSQKLITLYQQLLDTAGLEVTADGCVSIKAYDGEKAAPFTVKGKRLVLPTKEHMRNPSPKTVVYHPLQESMARGESEVFTEYRKALSVNINLGSLCMVRDLLVLVGSSSLHSKLSPDQSEVLSILKGASSKTLEAWDKIVKGIPDNQLYRSMVKFYMKPSGEIAGKSYTRVGVVSFPLYEQLRKADEKVYGVTLADKHREIIKKAIEFIFPGIEVLHHYSRGSNSNVAPMFDAMMKSFLAVSSAYEVVRVMYSDVKIPDLFENQIKFSSAWADDMAELDSLLTEVRKIPMQPGNEGVVETQAQAVKPDARLSSVAAAMSAAAAPAVAEVVAPVEHQPALPGQYQQPTHQQQPHQTHQTANQHQGRPMTFAERQALAARQQQTNIGQPQTQYVQGPYGPVAVQTVTVNNPDPYGAPMMVQQPMQQQPYQQQFSTQAYSPYSPGYQQQPQYPQYPQQPSYGVNLGF